MGRQNKDHQENGAVFGSSILLLQERFRQLQRLKEMRKERQLVIMFPKVTETHVDGAGKFMTTSVMEYEDPLALGLVSNMKQIACFRARKPQHDKFPSTDAPRGTTLDLLEKYADNYVDTSLHL